MGAGTPFRGARAPIGGDLAERMAQAEREKLVREINASGGLPSPMQRAAMARLDVTGDDVVTYRATGHLRPAESFENDAGPRPGSPRRPSRFDPPAPPPEPETRAFTGPNWQDGFIL